MDFLGDLRGLWALILLLFCVPSYGQEPPLSGTIVLFPPGKPTTDNLQGICKNRSLRPHYELSSLPSPGYSYLRRQAVAVNSLESLYGRCCESYGTQEDSLTLSCASAAWTSALATYCEEEFMVKTAHFHCCLKDKMFDCFCTWAPDPLYQRTGPQKQA